MNVYLYALAAELNDLDGMTGLEGEPLTSYRTEAGDLIWGALAAPPAVERATLAAQDAVVRALHARAAALLPMRFGSVFPSIEIAAAALVPRAERLRAQLQVVRGRAQMTLRMAAAGAPREVVADERSPQGIAPPPHEAASPGTAYLHAATGFPPRSIT